MFVVVKYTYDQLLKFLKFCLILFDYILFHFVSLQGQFNYGSEDLWVNGGAGFSSSSQQPEVQNNNNAYFVQVSSNI